MMILYWLKSLHHPDTFHHWLSAGGVFLVTAIIFAETGFRPVAPSVVKEYINKFPKVSNVYTVDSLGGWEAVQKKFFAEGAIFDQVLNKSR
jgi:ABC-type sulfate transport system substrate-binding protein